MTNPLVPFLMRHALAGVLAGWLTLAGLLWLDVGALMTLIRSDGAGPLALAMLAAGFAVTFASVAMGTAVMGLGRDGGRGGCRRSAPARAAPAGAATVRPLLR